MRRRGRGGQRPAVAVAVVLAGLAFLAGCGSTPYRPAAASRPAGQRSASTPGVPVAGTRAEAEAEARRLLGGLARPAGTRRLPQRPVPGAVSQPGENFGTGLDVYRLFRVPLSMQAAEQFVWAHLPDGLTFTPVSARWPTVVVDPANCMGSAVFANGVRQPSLTGTELYSVAQRLLPAPQRALPGMTKNSGGTASAPG
jgi:hypothetical protein